MSDNVLDEDFFINNIIDKKENTFDKNISIKKSLEEIRVIVAFLESILKFNDNSLSQFDDSWYIASIISGFCIRTVRHIIIDPTNNDSEKLIDRCLNEIERFRILELVFPSNNNIITRMCLISLIRFAYYKRITINKDFLMCLSNYPNIFSVRLVAIEGMLILFHSLLLIIEVLDWNRYL